VRRRAGALVLLLAFAAFFACVGSDPPPPAAKPDPNVPVGHYRGACTADGKCIDGLACDQGVCLYPDGGDPPSDGAAPGDGGDGGAVPDVPCPHDAAARANAIPCPNAPVAPCSLPSYCCFANPSSACVPESDLCNGGKKIRCKAPTCTLGGSPGRCCLRATAIDRTACPARVTYANLVDVACNANDTDCPLEERVCFEDADCDQGTCHTISLLDLSGNALTLGVCRPL
jgi:hypothetical protein